MLLVVTERANPPARTRKNREKQEETDRKNGGRSIVKRATGTGTKCTIFLDCAIPTMFSSNSTIPDVVNLKKNVCYNVRLNMTSGGPLRRPKIVLGDPCRDYAD